MVDTNGPDGPGAMLRLIRDGDATTRAELARRSGLARSTVSQRVEALMSVGLIRESGEAPSSGGRPPRTLAFNGNAGTVAVADLGATHCRLVVGNLAGEVLAEVTSDMDISRGPGEVLAWVIARFHDLLDQAGRTPGDVQGIGIGLPGPVEHSTGRAVHPPIMPGWHDVAVPGVIREAFPVPVLVDNDVNIMALGEYWTHWRDRVDTMLFIKVSTGIGCGIVANGHLYRGHDGAAGDMGHVQVSSATGQLCRCGNRGCLEAVAGGASIARELTTLGIPAVDARDLAKLVITGDPTSSRLVRTAGRHIGEVLAGAVNLFNPGAIVLGGDIALAGTELIAGVRELIYERSTALATHGLEIGPSVLGDHAGVVGANVMILESILEPQAVDAVVARQLA